VAEVRTDGDGAITAGRTADPTGRSRSSHWSTPALVVIAACVLAGAVLRVWIMAGELGTPDSDAAITGLMARHLLHGDFRAFMWRLSYHGTIALYPVAASIKVLGSNQFALELPFALMGAASTFLLWRIGTRFLTPFQAVFAALAFWLWPALYVWLGLNPYLAYVPTMLLGLATMLCVQRATEHDDPRLDWSLAGLFAGLGFWTSPNMAYFLAPLALWALVYHRRRLWPTALLAIPFAVLGALPWLWNNAHYGFDSLTAHEGLASGSYLDHLGYAFTHALPAVLGMRGVLDGRWIVGSSTWVSWMLYVGVLVALGVGVWRGLRARSPAAIGLLTAPFVFATVPFASNLANDWIGNGRYFYFFTPFVVLTLAHLVRPVASAAVVALLLAASTIWGFTRLVHYTDAFGAAPPLDNVIAVMERNGWRDAFGSFWITSRLTWESGERIVGVGTDLGPQLQEYEDRVRSSKLPVYVMFRADRGALTALHRRAAAAGVTMREVIVDDNYVIDVPSRKLPAPPAFDVSERP
jgi:hypothetical protein